MNRKQLMQFAQMMQTAKEQTHAIAPMARRASHAQRVVISQRLGLGPIMDTSSSTVLDTGKPEFSLFADGNKLSFKSWSVLPLVTAPFWSRRVW